MGKYTGSHPASGTCSKLCLNVPAPKTRGRPRTEACEAHGGRWGPIHPVVLPGALFTLICFMGSGKKIFLRVPVLRSKALRPLAWGMSTQPSGCSDLMFEITRDPNSTKEALRVDQGPLPPCSPRVPPDGGTHSTDRDKSEEGETTGDRVRYRAVCHTSLSWNHKM